ncbi:MAG: hypothetical protein OXU23_01355 [Candidatus Poribacteria bacterium]|nr:hypothetical protein [Candidatus Poribacteria bacterium]
MISKHFEYENSIDITINLVSGEKEPLKAVSKISIHLRMNGEFHIIVSHVRDGQPIEYRGIITENEFLRIKGFSKELNTGVLQ